ncbi:MAG: metal-dependent transcriptional regulator [Clostridia bacterium]|jgi:Mn-dependent DtxR family transcriptional regulator
MQITEAQEMYLETILILLMSKKRVISIDVARYMNYSKPTVSVMMKQFKNEGLIDMDFDNGITLTEKGFLIAQKVYERHEMIAAFFIALGSDKKTAYEDACKLEHDISDSNFNLLKKHYKDMKNKKETLY